MRQGAASVRARCRADGGQERGLAAQPFAGAVQRRRGISRCTDRSAGGCADWRTFSTTRARACGGLDAAEAAPQRCVSGRSRGRRWRGPSARATERPCRLSAVPAGLLTAARPSVPGKQRVCEPRPPAGHTAAAVTRRHQCTDQAVVHTGWGKRGTWTGERLRCRGLRHPACWGSSGRSLARGKPVRPGAGAETSWARAAPRARRRKEKTR